MNRNDVCPGEKYFLLDIELLRQFRDEMEGLNSWLQEVEAFLQAEEDLPVGDIETLEAQLEQSNVSSPFIF